MSAASKHRMQVFVCVHFYSSGASLGVGLLGRSGSISLRGTAKLCSRDTTIHFPTSGGRGLYLLFKNVDLKNFSHRNGRSVSSSVCIVPCTLSQVLAEFKRHYLIWFGKDVIHAYVRSAFLRSNLQTLSERAAGTSSLLKTARGKCYILSFRNFRIQKGFL